MVPDAMIFIMEQSNDGRKFNRGALLNAGFSQIFTRSQASDTVIFHDVDLILMLGSRDHIQSHCAKIRFAISPRCGSVTPGMPTWVAPSPCAARILYRLMVTQTSIGWGGEDDELGARIRHHRISIHKCSKGTMTDMENLSLQEKLSTLKESAPTMGGP